MIHGRNQLRQQSTPGRVFSVHANGSAAETPDQEKLLLTHFEDRAIKHDRINSEGQLSLALELEYLVVTG